MSLNEAMAKERKRLEAEIKKLDDQKSGLDAQIAKLHAELNAIDAYELAKSGASAKPSKRRTGFRNEVLDLISKSQGVKRAGIIDLMQAKGDKKAEQAISNALTNLKKQSQISLENGVYKVIAKAK